MRHIHTRFLWLQERVKEGRLEVIPVRGQNNPAYILTKAISGTLQEKRLEFFVFSTRAGIKSTQGSCSKGLERRWGRDWRAGVRGRFDEEKALWALRSSQEALSALTRSSQDAMWALTKEHIKPCQQDDE